MDRILVSACLLGRPVRYDGRARPLADQPALARWQREGRVVPLCPEVAAGLPTPRPPAEIEAGCDGKIRAGQGVVAALLRRNGIAVFSEDQLDALARAIERRHPTPSR